MLEAARNLVARREYVVVSSDVGGDGPKGFFRLSSAIDEAVDRTRTSDVSHPGWRVLRIERNRVPEVVWPPPAGDDDGDGEDSLVPRRPRRPPGSGAIALPLP